MVCVKCQTGKTRRGRTTLTLERGNTVLVVRRVPADVCGACGEAYVTARVTESMERLLKEAVARGVQVEVRGFAA